MKKIVIIGGTGYIGSSLFQFLNKDFQVDTIDLEWFGNFVNPNNIKKDYSELDESFWNNYDVIILLAGYSSVAMCVDKMTESLDNNVIKFVNLLTKIKNKKLIYASSSSVYGNTNGVVDERWDRYTPTNHYDLTKKIIDLYTFVNKGRTYGLRMGTLSGSSPNLRVDIMINKMYHTAKTTGKISVYNPQIYRPILGINDLQRAIRHLIEIDAEPGVYNMASLNANVDQISKAVAKSISNVEIINTGASPTYDFAINTDKFQKLFNFKFEESIESIVESLKLTYDSSNKGIR